MNAPAVALTIAGSDSSAGAGLQADLKAFSALGVYGLTVATAIVAERPGAVLSSELVSPGAISDQLRAVLTHYPIRAIKTGLLPSSAAVEAVAAALQGFPVRVVIDPVAVASTGTALASAGAGAALADFIRTCGRLVTPNRAEAEHFLGMAIPGPEEARDAARGLQQLFGCAVLLKGGHFEGPDAIDWLAHDPRGDVEKIRAPRIPGLDLHGTGCTYSAAIAAHLALGKELPTAVREARRYLHSAMQGHFHWPGRGDEGIKALANPAES
ncbi:MAG: bifunctional hydroxymethylpyrimidine kinase/phosphomethylpyrimidine kinase [Verrucomicrobia bacterium]|nr:bifunctional hydroxymethylpyrimidine kinase/phosphomethylpyrimidine kinase [Verrucomicrobiota bacterium]